MSSLQTFLNQYKQVFPQSSLTRGDVQNKTLSLTAAVKFKVKFLRDSGRFFSDTPSHNHNFTPIKLKLQSKPVFEPPPVINIHYESSLALHDK